MDAGTKEHGYSEKSPWFQDWRKGYTPSLAYSKPDYDIPLPHKPSIERLPGSIMSHMHVETAEELWNEFVNFRQGNLRKMCDQYTNNRNDPSTMHLP